jgi:hypothetical protein
LRLSSLSQPEAEIVSSVHIPAFLFYSMTIDWQHSGHQKTMAALSVEEPNIGRKKYNFGKNVLYTIWLEDWRFPPRIGQVGSDR